MQVLPDAPRVEEKRPEIGQLHRAVRCESVTCRVLHPCIRLNDEVSGKPGTDEDKKCGNKVSLFAELLLSEQKEPEETRFEKEGEDALHCERLADDTAGKFRKARPVRSELKFHRDAGDNADEKVYCKNFRPEPRGGIVLFIARPE